MESSTFSLKLKDFEGPIDLINTLVKEHKLDIMNLDVSLIAEQYNNFINSQIETIAINDAAEYLEMAIYLITLKSKKMIPVENIIGNENNFEYERDKLIQRIIEYRKYKEVASALENKRIKRLDHYSKPTNDVEDFKPESLIQESLPNNVSPQKLWLAINSAFEKYESLLYSKRKILVQELSVSEVEEELWQFLTNNFIVEISFTDYLKQLDELKLTQQYMVTTFLAILDLVKYQHITITQDPKDQEIYIHRIEG